MTKTQEATVEAGVDVDVFDGQMPALSALPAGADGPTGRPMPAFPEPAQLTTHGPARIIAMCNQ